MFTDKDGNIAWMEYNDYLIFRLQYLDSRRVAVEQEGNVMKVDEAVMNKEKA